MHQKSILPYIDVKVDLLVVGEPGLAAEVVPGHHSVGEHPVMAFVVVRLVTKEGAWVLSSFP